MTSNLGLIFMERSMKFSNDLKYGFSSISLDMTKNQQFPIHSS